jgi:hypothetical protein
MFRKMQILMANVAILESLAYRYLHVDVTVLWQDPGALMDDGSERITAEYAASGHCGCFGRPRTTMCGRLDARWLTYWRRMSEFAIV